MELSERTPLLYRGTINAAGTLSAELDLAGASLYGLIYSGATNGTLSFQVSALPDAAGGTYQDMLSVSVGPTGAAGAVSGITLEALRPYRYVKVKMSVAQTTGVLLLIPAKA